MSWRSRGYVTGLLNAATCRTTLKAEIEKARPAAAYACARAPAQRNQLSALCRAAPPRLLQLERSQSSYGDDDSEESNYRDWSAINECKRQLEALQESGHDWVPVVRFLNGVERPIYPETFEHEVYNVGTCYRVQTPLKLAWALTARPSSVLPEACCVCALPSRKLGCRTFTPMKIHKCQGMSLDYCRVSLAKVFATGQARTRARVFGTCVLASSYICGAPDTRLHCAAPRCAQAYVALSRARSMEGLELVGAARASCVRVDATVSAFYAAVAAGCVPCTHATCHMPHAGWADASAAQGGVRE